MVGGYFLIDCKELDLTKGATPQTIDGLYDKLKEAIKLNKPVYGYNCVWGSGKPVTPISVLVLQLNDTTITATAATLQINVTNADSVTIANLVA